MTADHEIKRLMYKPWINERELLNRKVLCQRQYDMAT